MMNDAKQVLERLVDMSRDLGRPERDLVILGEGNTSALCDDRTFWVKASGTQLATITADGFVQVRLEPILSLANGSLVSDDLLKDTLSMALVNPTMAKRPSVETVLHAIILAETNARYVGHTHPTCVNALTCSVTVADQLPGRLFPDEIVVCGPAPAFVPYTDPGLPLALAVRESLSRYADKWGAHAKVVLMQNHGMIALGASPTEVVSISSMYGKVCRVLAGTAAFGGPRFLSEEAVARIYTRPDELYRRKQLKLDD